MAPTRLPTALFSRRRGAMILDVKVFKLILAFVAILVVMPRLQAAPHTNFLAEADAAINGAYLAFKTDARAHATFGRALRQLRAPSHSVAQDCATFARIAATLRTLMYQPGAEAVAAGLSNAFASFALEAAAEVQAQQEKVSLVTPFQPLRERASNALGQVVVELNGLTNSTDFQAGVFSLRHAYVSLGAAAKLAAQAAARQGYAPDSVLDAVLYYKTRSDSYHVSFYDVAKYAILATSTPRVVSFGAYTYQRTGLNTGVVTLDETVLALKFASRSRGRYTMPPSEGSPRAMTGVFTIEYE